GPPVAGIEKDGGRGGVDALGQVEVRRHEKARERLVGDFFDPVRLVAEGGDGSWLQCRGPGKGWEAERMLELVPERSAPFVSVSGCAGPRDCGQGVVRASLQIVEHRGLAGSDIDWPQSFHPFLQILSAQNAREGDNQEGSKGHRAW